jgi:hypothetical protein
MYIRFSQAYPDVNPWSLDNCHFGDCLSLLAKKSGVSTLSKKIRKKYVKEIRVMRLQDIPWNNNTTSYIYTRIPAMLSALGLLEMQDSPNKDPPSKARFPNSLLLDTSNPLFGFQILFSSNKPTGTHSVTDPPLHQDALQRRHPRFGVSSPLA